MNCETYFYNCSKPYLNSISPRLFSEVGDVVTSLPKRATQAEVNRDLFWVLTSRDWSFDSLPAGLEQSPPADLKVKSKEIQQIKEANDRDLCLTSTTLEARWRSDFAKSFGNKLAQIEVQFGKVESMFKDFCGFKIARYERRLALGIEIIMHEPGRYFAHRRTATSGMAYFDIAKKTLPAVGLDCPIWLIGIKD